MHDFHVGAMYVDHTIEKEYIAHSSTRIVDNFALAIRHPWSCQAEASGREAAPP
jgi:hypothetical protein